MKPENRTPEHDIPRQEYVAPDVVLISVNVEAGFANSGSPAPTGTSSNDLEKWDDWDN